MATTTPDSTKIALDPSGTALILVPTKVNGQGPFQFILDTGNAGEVIVTPELAERLNLKKGESIKDVYNVGLDTDAWRSTIDSLEVGDIRKRKTKVGISGAISQVAKQLKKPIEGNFGYEFLKSYAVTFDMKKHELTLAADPKDQGGENFELAKSMKLILVKVTINGKPFQFVLDSGASFTCVSRNLAKGLNLKMGVTFPMNNSNKETATMTKLDSFQVAGKLAKEMPVVAADFLADLSKRTKCPIDGVIGRNFWSQYVMTIDYPHRKLRFE